MQTVSRSSGCWQRDPATGLEILPGRRAVREPETGSTLETRAGLPVLHLRGEPYLRGLAHGRLLRRAIQGSGILPFFGRFASDLLRDYAGRRRLPTPLRALLELFLDRYWVDALPRLLLEDNRRELCGVADGAGLEREEVLRASIAVDLLQVLVAGLGLRPGRLGRLGGLPKAALSSAGSAGCSGAYARGRALRGGTGAYFARNLDFPGALVWQSPVLIVSHPDEEVETWVPAPPGANGDFRRLRRRRQPYLYLSVAGFPGFGLTGMNASGVAMGTFQVWSHHMARRPLLSLDLNHDLFTRAEGLPATLHLLEAERLRTGFPHTLLLADRQQAVCLECDSERIELRAMAAGDGLLAQTNHFFHPRLRSGEVMLPLQQEYSRGRYRLIQEALRENEGRLNRRRMIDIIACNLDRCAGTAGLVGDFPAQPVTLSSVLFELHTGNFWVATGSPPGVCYNSYVGFNAFALFEGEGVGPRLPRYRRSRSPLDGRRRLKPLTAAARESMRRITKSEDLLRAGRSRQALQELEEAIRLYPDPGYRYLSVFLYLENGMADRALAVLQALSRERPFPPVKAANLALWEGRCLDLLGRREEALRAYLRLLGDSKAPPPLQAAARRGLRRRYRRSRIPTAFSYVLMGPLEPD